MAGLESPNGLGATTYFQVGKIWSRQILKNFSGSSERCRSSLGQEPRTGTDDGQGKDAACECRAKLGSSFVPASSPTLDPAPVTKIRFENGNAVTIREGFVQASPPELTAIIDALAAALPGYGKMPFILDEDVNIAQGFIRMAGAGKIVRRDKMPGLP